MTGRSAAAGADCGAPRPLVAGLLHRWAAEETAIVPPARIRALASSPKATGQPIDHKVQGAVLPLPLWHGTARPMGP